MAMINRIKKIVFMITAAAIAASMLGGCGGTGGNTVIKIGYVTDKSTINEHIESFESTHKGVKIITVEWGYDPNTFSAMVENGTLPDIYDTHFTEVQKLIDEGYAADITQELKDYNLFNRINDFMMENISKNGKVYFVPRTVYSMGLYINVHLFQEAGLVDENGIPIAPDSFEELRQTARLIKERTGKCGFVFPTTDRYGGWYFTVLAWNYGVHFVEEDNGEMKASFDTPECADALRLLQYMKWKDGSLQTETDVSNDDVFAMIGKNEAAMTFAQNVQLDNAVKFGLIAPQNIGLAKMPRGPAGRVSMVGGGYYGINPNITDEKKRIAFEWLMYDKGYTADRDAEKELEQMENSYREKYEKNDGVIGITGMQLWNDSAANSSFEDELIAKYSNVNPDYVSSFNNASDVEYRLEEPVCTQELYKILDECILRALEDPNADCDAIIAEANQKFQTSLLDYEN